MGDLKVDNQVRMVGVLPSSNADTIPVHMLLPDSGTQVAADNEADNSTAIVHTVTAAKTLYLSAATLGLYNNGLTRARGYLAVRDASDVLQYYILICGCPPGDGKMGSVVFSPPLEIPESCDVYVVSGLADFKVNGMIHGYEL